MAERNVTRGRGVLVTAAREAARMATTADRWTAPRALG